MEYGVWERNTVVLGGGRELVDAEGFHLEAYKQAKQDVATWFHVVGAQDAVLDRLWAVYENARLARLQAWSAYHTN